jgi:hypothetical protein
MSAIPPKADIEGCDDLDGERFRWRGRDDCWHYAARFHDFLSGERAASYLHLSLASTRFPIIR